MDGHVRALDVLGRGRSGLSYEKKKGKGPTKGFQFRVSFVKSVIKTKGKIEEKRKREEKRNDRMEEMKLKRQKHKSEGKKV